MDLLAVDGQKRLVADLGSDAEPNLGEFSYGEVIPLRIAKVRPNTGSGQNRWKPVDISASTLRVGLGSLLTGPTSGFFRLMYGVDAADLNYNFTLAQLQNALTNDLSLSATATDMGGGLFSVLFLTTGAKTLFTATLIESLSPQSTLEVHRVVTGDGSTNEVQSLRLVQLPAVETDSFTLSDGAHAIVTVLATGGTGVNHKVTVQLDPVPIGGYWTLTVDGQETDFLAYNISASDLEDALALLSTVGIQAAGTEPNVGVSIGDDGLYYITFLLDKAATDMGTITTTATALTVLQYMEGTLDLRDIDAERLLASGDTTLYLEIEETAGSSPQKLVRKLVNVVSPVLNVE